MSTREKLIERIKSQPKDFTFEEAVRLFNIVGFKQNNKGTTSGSRVEFVNEEKNLSYIMHKPHPSNILKSYAVKQLLAYLKEEKLIK